MPQRLTVRLLRALPPRAAGAVLLVEAEDRRLVLWPGEGPESRPEHHALPPLAGRGEVEERPVWAEALPAGVLLDELAPGAPGVAAALADVARALSLLHGSGRAHGGLDAACVQVRPGGGLLLGAAGEGEPAEDVAALRALAARWLGRAAGEGEELGALAAQLDGLAEEAQAGAGEGPAAAEPEAGGADGGGADGGGADGGGAGGSGAGGEADCGRADGSGAGGEADCGGADGSGADGGRAPARALELLLHAPEERTAPVDEVRFEIGLDEAGRGLLDTWAGRTAPGEEPTGAIGVAHGSSVELTALLARLAAGLGRDAPPDRFAAAAGVPSRAVKALLADEPLDPLPVPEGLPLPGTGFLDATGSTEVTAVAERPTLSGEGPERATAAGEERERATAAGEEPERTGRVGEPEISAGLLVGAVALALAAGALGTWLLLGGGI